ncbi:hypothetical protein FOA52_003949 [Chlamydomonas sp. UWO 241]|nr:hypothetical protein FOA52_003949 [Chlamydomonas sp. UWO 241]
MFKRIIAEHGIPKAYALCGAQEDAGCASAAFATLAKTIVYQQLAPAAADKIIARTLAAFGVPIGERLTPGHVAVAVFETILVDGKRKVMLNGSPSGLSEAKARALQSLAEHFGCPNRLGGGLDLRSLPPHELSARLCAVRGLGPWSVDMFRLFSLLDSDVMPVGDLGVRRGVLSTYGRERCKCLKDEAARVGALTTHWAPYRSVGSVYMWRVLDGTAEQQRRKKQGSIGEQ